MGRLRHGIHAALEEEANRLIKESLQGVTSREAKSDILTEWKQQDRWNHEVYNPTGVADAGRRGMFTRAWNRDYPHLNSRDGAAPARRIRSSLEDFVQTNSYTERDEDM